MPFTHEVDSDKRRVFVSIKGRIHLQDIVGQIDEMARKGLFAYSHLVDARESTFDLSTEDVRAINDMVTRLKKTLGSGRTALIAGDDATFGMARMYQIISQQTVETFNVFRDPSEAEAWLNEGMPASQ